MPMDRGNNYCIRAHFLCFIKQGIVCLRTRTHLKISNFYIFTIPWPRL